ncbi:MAG: hypothetical protein EOL87_16805 [Spartobacteria bacterium]|nr:hypothetical protein [Spartobacteria bacterium]
MKTLKHRFSFWYNRLHDRKGTLWSERFKSVLVEGGEALCTVAAYIEMNPVRAGIVTDPAAYRFCGFGEAMDGSLAAQAGVMAVVERKGLAFGVEVGGEWSVTAGHYYESILLYRRSRFELLPSQAFLLRCRYFTDGQVVGSREFVEQFFKAHRDYFGSGRRTGGRKMKGEWPALFAIRDVHTS